MANNARVTFTLPIEVFNHLKASADKLALSVSALVRMQTVMRYREDQSGTTHQPGTASAPSPSLQSAIDELIAEGADPDDPYGVLAEMQAGGPVENDPS